jgi:signal transduction histidine kinase
LSGVVSLLPVGLDPYDPLVPLIAWAARATTFFNVLVLLWLGLTVLLTAERRSAGTWLTGGGLLLGGLCSILRASAQAAQPITTLAPVDLLWRASWLPFAGASYLWSVVLVWYAGHLRSSSERRGLLGLSALGFGVFLLLLDARPAGLAPPIPQPLFTDSPSSPWWLFAFESGPGDAYLALAAYLAFTLLCVGIGLHALHHPRSPDRFMGELASRRASPWLTATSLVTLGLSLVVGFGATGVLVVKPLVLFDLLGALLLAAQVVLLGQAIVSYEVFTGKTLPRRGLARYWRNALILAAGFGGLMAISLGLPLDQSYRLLLALVIVAIFYALLSWRSFVERERSLDQLRPFVTSDRLVDHLLATEAALVARSDLTARPLKDPFRALCDGLLGARVAYLCPVGPLASLVGAPLAVPAGSTAPSAEVLAALAAGIGASRQLCQPIDPTTHGGAAWAVPLWGERSLIGLLLLGDRWDGSLYAQEEMEIARAAGERLIDARAAGELARRLLLLQRRRLAEDQLLDGRVRRALHDDVLPLLHTALLSLNGRQQPQSSSNGTVAAPTEAAGLLADAHRQVSALLAALPPALAPDVARLGLAGALRRVVDDLGGEIDAATWEIPPDGARAAAALSPLAAEVLFGAAREAIRNAARHGRGAAPDDARRIRLRVAIDRTDDGLTVRIEDDGVGLASRERAPGDQPGGGQGLVLHGTLLTVIGGSMAVESAPGHGTRVTLRVPSPG